MKKSRFTILAALSFLSLLAIACFVVNASTQAQINRLENQTRSKRLSAFGLVSVTAPVQISPYIAAVPNGTIPNGQTEATNVIVWNAGSNYPYCEVYMTVNNGEETELGRGHDGKRSVLIRLGSTYVFKMIVYLGDQGADVREVAKLTVVGKLAQAGGTLGKRRRPGGDSGVAGIGRLGDKRANATSNVTKLPFFYDVRVVPQGDSLQLSFQTFEPSEFFIEVSKESPDANLPTEIPAGQRLPAAFPRNTRLAAFTLPGLSGVKKEHQATIRSAPGQVLEADALYYYVITAKAPDGGFRRYVGKFTNVSRTVRIVWERVKIINDGDPDAPGPLPPDCGEIDLWFWANYGQPGAGFAMINKLSGGKACSSHVYDLGREILIRNAPSTLTLSVSGRDNDQDDYSGSDLFGSSQPAPLSGPRDTGDDEQNVAKMEFNLNLFEIDSTVPFELISMRPGKGQGDFMFLVHGRIIITRSK